MIHSLFKSRLREHLTKERMNNGAKSSGQYSRAAKTVHFGFDEGKWVSCRQEDGVP
jgi:hypothetical protein